MLLCLACGIVDAVGNLRHGIFAANMTGDTVLLGAALIVVALSAMPDSKVFPSLITFAMGAQSTAITQFAGVTLSTVVITSTMARIA